MGTTVPRVYEVSVVKGSVVGVLSRDGGSGFLAIDRKAGGKLYVLAAQRVIVYVGVTTQPMARRLRQGRAGPTRNGYHGYKWLAGSRTLDLSIWSAPKVVARPMAEYLQNSSNWPRLSKVSGR